MVTRHKIALLMMVCLGIFLGRIEAQKNDYTWIVGYGQCGFPNSGTRDISFANNEPEILNTCRDIYFSDTNANLSDDAGNLLCFTNGLDFYGRDGAMMPNGDSLFHSVYYLNWQQTSGGRLPQGALLLPKPGHPDKVLLLHTDYVLDINVVEACDNLFLTEVDMSLNGGNGDVSMKRQELILDSLSLGTLAACRHANGRDWWVVIFNYTGSAYYSFLVSPEGASTPVKQSLGLSFGLGAQKFGQTAFSPNGAYFACTNPTDGLHVWRFDRCTGQLYDNVSFESLVPGIFGFGYGFTGVGFSPDSRFLYHGEVVRLYQIDLQDYPLLDTLPVAIGSPFCVFTGACVDSSGFPRLFSRMSLAPDGRLYVLKGGQDFQPHRVHRPNLPGTACTARQLDFQLPNYINYSYPNHPHYRLGPLDGSACDTLGLDQPLAVHAERLDFGPVPLGSAATLSFWLRNPGEGALVVDTFRFDSAQYASPLPLPFTVAPGDSVQVPVTFAPTALPLVEAQLRVFHNGIAGISTVQLTGLGDSVVSALPAEGTVPGLVLWPNPTAGGVQVAFTSARAFDTEAVLYDALGRTVLALPVQVVAGSNRFALSLEGLPGGVYSVMLRGVGAGRVVKH